MINLLQAEKASWNYVGIYKLSNISGKRRDLVPKFSGDADGSDMDSDSSDDSDEDGEDEGHGGSGTPVLQALFLFFCSN